jgi:hypothetical protein
VTPRDIGQIWLALAFLALVQFLTILLVVLS